MEQRYNLNDNIEIKLDWTLRQLRALSSPEIKAQKAERFAVADSTSWGVYQADLRALSKEIGKDTELGIELFDTGFYDARMLTAFLCRPKELRPLIIEAWVEEFSTWEMCDSFCMKLFKYRPEAIDLAYQWTDRKEEFVKRAGIVLMTTLGFARKEEPNETFEAFILRLISETHDERLYVKKAISWAFRQIGKRNRDLRDFALEQARVLLLSDSKSAQWIAKDVIRELSQVALKFQDYPKAIYRP